MNANLSQNVYLAPPGGFPCRLSPQGDTTLSGVVPLWATSVQAVIQTERGTAGATLSIYNTPATPGGNDGSLVARTSLASFSSQQQTISLAIPSGSRATYIAVLAISNVGSSNTETIARDASVTNISQQAAAPVGVRVSSFTVT